MFHSILKRKRFKNLFQQTSKKKLPNFLLPFINDVSEADSEVDLQDILNRFTFDSIFIIVIGFDPNWLPTKISDLREISYQKYLIVIEEVLFYRNFIPSCLWMLQKWFLVGQEKKYEVAQENLDRFLYERVTFAKREEKSKCISSEEMDECYFNFVKALMKEGSGNEGLSEKYLRDNALSLLLAGNGTISASLSWFFWLVSPHPIVKIVSSPKK